VHRSEKDTNFVPLLRRNQKPSDEDSVKNNESKPINGIRPMFRPYFAELSFPLEELDESTGKAGIMFPNLKVAVEWPELRGPITQVKSIINYYCHWPEGRRSEFNVFFWTRKRKKG